MTESSFPVIQDGQPVLKVSGLKVYYHISQGIVKAVDNIDFTVGCGEFVGLSGESGCGKTTTAMTLLQILPKEGVIEGGQAIFGNTDILTLDKKSLEAFRWKGISMVFQGAMNSLNPVHRVIDQMVDAVLIHGEMSKDDAKEVALDLIESVGIERSRATAYPHQLSGGMKQRLMIA
jgi:peptide/nickel transport system ATP-binding protein